MDNQKKFIFAGSFALVLAAAMYTQVEWKKRVDPLPNLGSSNQSQNYTISADGTKIVPLTKLTPEQLKIQETQGCNASFCHNK